MAEAQLLPTPRPYEIAVDEDLLHWINDRVQTTRIPQGKSLPLSEKDAFGLPTEIAIEIHNHWTKDYDWRAMEKKLNNKFSQFTLPIEHNGEELNIHFVHHRSKSPNAIPLLFVHGWPGSFLEVGSIIQLLTDPEKEQAYHVIAPSLPGYGFSSTSVKPFSPSDHASILHKLMKQLGYEVFMAQGGDWGSMIIRLLALDFPESCPAIHVNMVAAVPPSLLWQPFHMLRVIIAFTIGSLQSDYEAKMINRMKWWSSDENGYLAIQGTKPLTLQYSLSDSPFGFACWIRDKIGFLVDEYTWDPEEVITMAMLYIINGTLGHAELYRYAHGNPQKDFRVQFGRKLSKKSSFGVSVFPKDVFYAHKWWAQATIAESITFWKEHDSGGHFASLEKPKELVEDIRAFTASIGTVDLKSLQGA